MSIPRRALVDFDWSACGLWLVLSPEELRAPTPKGGKWAGLRPDHPRPRPFADLLSSELLDDLQQWNDDQDDISRIFNPPDPTMFKDIQTRARSLATRVQDELGSDWEVLFDSEGAWHWVKPPRNWIKVT